MWKEHVINLGVFIFNCLLSGLCLYGLFIDIDVIFKIFGIGWIVTSLVFNYQIIKNYLEDREYMD